MASPSDDMPTLLADMRGFLVAVEQLFATLPESRRAAHLGPKARKLVQRIDRLAPRNDRDATP